MAATLGEEAPCTFAGCGQPGKVLLAMDGWAIAICAACEARAIRMWTEVEADERARRERLRRKKERARTHGLIAISARG